jgi:transcriptional regulator with XRE-family HTH domain
MKQPATLLREAREARGLTQAQLAARLGLSQPSIAALERPGANPTMRTLERALNALDRTLTVTPRRLPDVDEEQLRRHLAMTPTQRLDTFQRSQRNLNQLLRQTRGVVRPT